MLRMEPLKRDKISLEVHIHPRRFNTNPSKYDPNLINVWDNVLRAGTISYPILLAG
jgi:hypothetical protein